MFRLFTKKTVPTKWKSLATAAFVVMIVVNGLAGGTTLIGGVDTAAISDMNPNLFAPAGYTFMIWSVIYLLLAAFLVRVWGLWSTKKPHLSVDSMTKLLQLFTLSSVLNVLWLLAWQYQVLWLSVIIMLALLVTLVTIHRSLSRRQISDQESLAVRLPFSVYTGWITVATIANITTWLVSIGWDGWGVSDDGWTIIVLILGAVIGLVIGLLRRDAAYMAVFVWAYVGILTKHMTTFGAQYLPVIVTLVVLISILAVYALLVGVGRMIVARDRRMML